MLRVRPVVGRLFQADDSRQGAPPVMMLGYETWKNRYGSDPSIIGRVVKLEQSDRQVVGVAPAGFTFPPNAATDIIVPLTLPTVAPAQRKAGWTFAIGRLKPGRTLDDAAANLTAVSRQLETEFPQQNHGIRIFSARAPHGTRRQHEAGARSAVRGRRRGAAHRVRERREPVARALLGPPARDVRATGVRRRRGAAGGPAAHGEPGARARRRRGWRAHGVLGGARTRRAAAAVRKRARAQRRPHQRQRARVHAWHRRAHDARVRSRRRADGAVGEGRRRVERVARSQHGREGASRDVHARRRRGRPRDRVARRGRADPPQLRQSPCGRSWLPHRRT